MGDSNLIGQLENVQGFINKANYPNPNESKALSEWGAIGNLRFFLSSRGSVTNNASMLGADIYNIFVAAQEAYCSIDLDGSSAQFIYHPPGYSLNFYLDQYKSPLIDSEPYGECYGNEAQAEAEMLLAA